MTTSRTATLSGPAPILAAAFLWGLSGGISGLLIEHGWPPLLVSFCRGCIGAAALWLWWLCRPPVRCHPDKRLTAWSVVAGVGVAGNLGFYCLGIAHANVAVAATLMYTAPIHVYLISLVAGLERIHAGKAFAIVLVMVGIVLLTGVLDTRASEVSGPGIVTGLLSGVSYAAFIFGFRYARQRGPAQPVLGIAFAVFVLVMLPFVDLQRATATPGSDDAALFVALGIAGAGLSFPLYVFGLRRALPAVASILALIEPVTASLFGVVVLGDHLIATQLSGMALIIGTITLLSVTRSRDNRDDPPEATADD